MNTKQVQELEDGDVFQRNGSTDKVTVIEMLGTERSTYTDEMGMMFSEMVTTMSVNCKYGPQQMHLHPKEVVIILK
jgi:hypothetical protein